MSGRRPPPPQPRPDDPRVRRRQVLLLRRAGVSWRRIATDLGISTARVRALVLGAERDEEPTS